MQVFCGITTDHGADTGQDAVRAVALVAAGGGLLATDTFADGPRGWVRFAGLLARQTAGPSPVSIAVDGEIGQIAEFAAAAGHLVVEAESPLARSKDALDDAVALARGLATGEVQCAQPLVTRPDTAALRPVLDTVAVASRARHEAAEALTCLLRAVFPAALAAWDDPSETNAVAILTHLPQPGAIHSISTEDLAADLATVADPGQVAAMAGALTEAIREIGGGDDPAVAPSVSGAAEAVAAWDRSLEGLIGLLQSRRPRTEAGPPQAAPEPSEPRHGLRDGPHRKMRLPGDLPDRSSLRSLDPNSQMHSFVSPDLEATQVLPDDDPLEGDAPTRGIRRRRDRAAGLPQQDPLGGEGRRHPWQPKEDTFEDLAALAGDDDGLLIFGQARSAWFKRPETEEPDAASWHVPGDEGWRTARHVTESPEAEDDTTPAGLPRRKPQANLVPGSVIPDAVPGSDEPIDRDPEVLAYNTAGYFKGWGKARGGRNQAPRRNERMAAR
ncbi:hypothetical protein [Glycomyces xiaoerkulensis]|uniref:hypothetical protein n=1 Tax=Glycomyces xiaoerkulensis TaxID=2038139 RepID=UPI000C25FA04|nr:hypothetical protein [Glycomyces xiaoerkulensis]